MSHLNCKHGISVAEYKRQFNMDENSSEGIVAPSTANKLSQNIVGERNPAYQHGGRLSPFSKQFVKYDGMSDEQKEQIIGQHVTDWIVNAPPENRRMNKSYWTTRGFSEEEAKLKVIERQTTFNLEICIQKFGEEEGLKRWIARQELWQNTMFSKPEEEIERINRLKIYKKGALSNISLDLFGRIHIHGAQWGIKRDGNEGEKMLKISSKKRIMLDFTYQNKVIEFFGDYWHANPLKYMAEQKIFRKILAVDKWQSDKERLEFIKNSGYSVLVVWENDYRKNPEQVVQICSAFLSA